MDEWQTQPEQLERPEQPVQPAKHAAEKPKTGLLETVYELLSTLIVALLVFTVVFNFAYRQVVVEGDSMNDTLTNGDRLVMQTAFYTPAKGDIVVVYQETEPEKPLIKRVIATGGDSLRLDVANDAVYLKADGTDEWVQLDEPYVHYPLSWGVYWEDCNEVTVPQGCVFVMGDHRNNSKDSRYESIGFVPADDIVGKAVLRVAPLNDFGTI